MEKSLASLVKDARGNRKLKDYAEASGVDAAIISKMEHGIYVPVRSNVIERLTSEKADPQNGVTFDMLMDALTVSSKSRKKGTTFALSSAQAFIDSLSGLPITTIMTDLESILEGSVKKDKAVSDEIINVLTKQINDDNQFRSKIEDINARVQAEIQRYTKITDGMLCVQLAVNGIQYGINSGGHEQPLDNKYDTSLSIYEGSISKLIIRHVYFTEDERNQTMMVKLIKMYLGEFSLLKPDPTRQVLLVFDYDDAYNYIKEHASSLSYKGNLSATLIDMNSVTITDEVILSTYGEESDVVRLTS